MRIIGIIPARIGSKRIPNKNYKNFCGKPLVLHALLEVLKANLINRIIVTGNHKNLSSIIPHEYIQYFITRPEEISHDKARGFTYVNHVLNYCKANYKEDFTHFVALPPTAPLRTAKDIDNCISILIEKDCDSVTSMVEVNMMYHGIKQKTIKSDGTITAYLEEEKGRSAFHELPKVYVRNCAIYASKVGVLENNAMIGPNCKGYIMPPERSVDINEMIDFEFAEFLFKKSKDRK